MALIEGILGGTLDSKDDKPKNEKQIITGWDYECGVKFRKKRHSSENYISLFDKKEEVDPKYGFCYCGKGCNIKKFKITVEEA